MSTWEERMSQRAKARQDEEIFRQARRQRAEEWREEARILREEADDIWQAFKAGPPCWHCYEWTLSLRSYYLFGGVPYGWMHKVIGDYDDPDEVKLCHHDCHDEPYFTGLPAMA